MKKTLNLEGCSTSSQASIGLIEGMMIFSYLQEEFGLDPDALCRHINALLSGTNPPTFETLKADALTYFADYVKVLSKAMSGEHTFGEKWYSNTSCSAFLRGWFYRPVGLDAVVFKIHLSDSGADQQDMVKVLEIALPQVVAAVFDEAERLRLSSLKNSKP